MSSTTTPATSFQYFGSHASHNTHTLASQFRNVFDRLQHVVHALGNTVGSVYFGLRQEVPFERWFFDHGFQIPLDQYTDLIKARAWAIVAACESVIRATAEAIAYVFSLVFEPQTTKCHLEVLKVQMQSFGLSVLAIISPNLAKEKAYNARGESLIGASIFNWTWGSLYTGTVDAPLWKIECGSYPWIHLPGTP